MFYRFSGEKSPDRLSMVDFVLAIGDKRFFTDISAKNANFLITD